MLLQKSEKEIVLAEELQGAARSEDETS